jgi:hypothetical protein
MQGDGVKLGFEVKPALHESAGQTVIFSHKYCNFLLAPPF